MCRLFTSCTFLSTIWDLSARHHQAHARERVMERPRQFNRDLPEKWDNAKFRSRGRRIFQICPTHAHLLGCFGAQD
jgi:hypothetical protein